RAGFEIERVPRPVIREAEKPDMRAGAGSVVDAVRKHRHVNPRTERTDYFFFVASIRLCHPDARASGGIGVIESPAIKRFPSGEAPSPGHLDRVLRIIRRVGERFP